MNERTLERRLELLKLEGNGLQTSEIVNQLSAKYGVTPRAVYADFETRSSWQPILENTKESILKILNRHEQLYRKTLVAYMQAKSDHARVAALNLLRQINVDVAELTGAKLENSAQLNEIHIKWEDPEVCKKQY